MAQDKRPLRASDVRPSGVGGAIFLSRGPDVFELGGIESKIWRLANGDNNVDAIVTEIVEAYDIEADAAEGDVIDFLQDLHQEGLITWSQSN